MPHRVTGARAWGRVKDYSHHLRALHPTLPIVFSIGVLLFCTYAVHYVVVKRVDFKPHESTILDQYSFPTRPEFEVDDRPAYVTLNSIRNNPNWKLPYGPDGAETLNVTEFTFFKASEIGKENYRSALVLSPGNSYRFVVFFHNNADPSRVQLDAENARLKIRIPGVIADFGSATARISADNAMPPVVGSSIVFGSREGAVNLRVSGDAKVVYTGGYTRNFSASELWNDGLLLDCGTAMNILPPGDECSGRVEFSLDVDSARLNGAVTANIGDGDGWFDSSVQKSVKVGEWIDVKYSVWNTGTEDVPSASVRVATNDGFLLTPIESTLVPDPTSVSEHLIELDETSGSGKIELSWRVEATNCGENELSFESDDGQGDTLSRSISFLGDCE